MPRLLQCTVARVPFPTPRNDQSKPLELRNFVDSEERDLRCLYARAMARTRDPLAPQPGPQPTREDSRDIVEAIVGAVMAIADPEATMDAFAERAGVGVASVYRYFPSRGAIYAEISRRLHRKFLSQLREVLARSFSSVDETVTAVCRVVVDGPGVSRELRRCLNAAVPLSWSQESADDTYRVAITEIVVWLTENMEAPPADLPQRVFVAFSGARGAIMMAMLFPDLAPESEKLIQYMAHGTLGYLLAPP